MNECVNDALQRGLQRYPCLGAAKRFFWRQNHVSYCSVFAIVASLYKSKESIAAFSAAHEDALR